MQTAVQLALGYVFGDVPWYLLACVPFMGRRRISRRGVYLLAAFMALFRAACGFVLMLGVPDWQAYTGAAYLVTYILLAALFLLAFRVSPARLLYVYLLVYSISTCLNQITVGTLTVLFPGQRISLSAFPLLTVVQFVVFLLLLPFLYRLFRGSLKQAVEELDTRSILLLCVTPLIFAVAALVFMTYADRQTETAAALYLLLSIAGIVSYLVNLRLLLGAAERLRSEHELETRLALQAQNFENLTQSIEAARAARHDLRHHINAIRDFAARDDKDGMLRYLDEYTAGLPADEGPDWCENRAVNALLKHYLSRAARAGVRLDVKLDLPMGAGVPDTDLCVVFGNIFENAARSAAAAGDGAYLRARCESGETDIVLTVENSAGPAAAHGEGLGLKNVEAAAKRHGGAARFKERDGVFYSRVLLHKAPPPSGAGIK